MEWRTQSAHGVPVGKWIHYSRDGSVDMIEHWESGSLVRLETLGPDGQLRDAELQEQASTQTWPCEGVLQ